MADSDLIERLQWLRGRMSRKEAAEKYRVGYENYKKMLAGERGLTPENAISIARHHHVSPGWLLFGEGTPEGRMRIPLGGYIVGGQKIELFTDTQQPLESVDAVLSAPNAVSFEVRSDSMEPLAREGDLAFFGPPSKGEAIYRLIGRDCAVLLESGDHLFKILERGETHGVFNLHSYNSAKVIRRAAVHEARPLLAVRRRYVNWQG